LYLRKALHFVVLGTRARHLLGGLARLRRGLSAVFFTRRFMAGWRAVFGNVNNYPKRVDPFRLHKSVD